MKKFDLMKKMARKKSGFSGITHTLIALVLFELMWLLPLFNFLLKDIKNQSLFYIVTYWLVVCGAALLPDLDTNVSSAGYALGLLGKLMHTFMVASSSLIYTVFKRKKDDTLTQHRMFWHTPLSCALLYGYGYLCYNMVSEQGTFLQCCKANGLNSIMLNYAFILVLDVISYYLALTKLFYNVGRIAFKKLARTLQFLTSVGFTAFAVLKCEPAYLFQLFSAVCLGCLFHDIGDFFSKGSAPLLFPIPVKEKAFWKPWFPWQVETAGTLNRILDMVLFVISIILMVVIVKGKDFIMALLA